MSVRNVIVIAFAVTVVASVTLAAVVRTYTVAVGDLHANVIWNEHQLVVFVPVTYVGSADTVVQQIARPLYGWLGAPPFRRASRSATFTTIIRLDDGVMQPPVRISRALANAFQGTASEASAFENPILVLGGIWTGRELKYLEPADYFRVLRATPPDEAHKWHSGGLLGRAGTTELPVRLRGETVTLKGSRSAAEASIDLVGTEGVLTRVFDVSVTSRPVSAAEYESILARKQTR